MQTMRESILDAWHVNNRAMTFLVGNFPGDIWPAALADFPRKTIRSIAAHVHNVRCQWLKSLAKSAGFRPPRRVDPRTVTPRALAAALEASNKEMIRLFEAGIENGGDFPGVSSKFIWGAMPRNAILFLAYAISHESHHRGQILLLARALGHRLPSSLVGGLWQWSSRLRECREANAARRRG